MIRAARGAGLLAAGVMIWLAGCGGADQDAPATDSGQGGEAGAESAAAGPVRSLPESFPEDVPVPPEMDIMLAVTTGAGNKIRGRTDRSVAAVADYLDREMAAEGWTKSPAGSAGSGSIRALQYDKGSRKEIVKVFASGDHTIVEMVYIPGD